MLSVELSAYLALKALALALVPYYIGFAIYNVFFHPLRRYPGPRLMAVSRLPIVFGVMTGHSTGWINQMHAKYGPVVRVAPDELSYASASAWKDIYGSHPARPGGMPRDMTFFRSVEDQNGIHSILSANNEDHARMRRLYAQALSKRALAQQEPLILGHVNRMMEKLALAAAQKQPVDIVDMFNFTLFDVVCDLQFGESLHLLDDPTYHPWVRSHLGVIRSASLLASLIEFPILRILFNLTLPRLVKTERESYFQMLNARLDHRLSAGVKRPDLVHFVMEARTEADGISEGELRATAPIIMMAGSETSSTALSGWMAHMLQQPEMLRQVQHEVRAKYRSSEDISMQTLKDLPLLDACIKEALRAYAAVPGILPRIVPAPGATISGDWVPEGTRVYVTPLAAFRSAANFHEPERFAPERWFTQPEKQYAQDQRDACKPFSVGTRDCVGREMAQYMMLLILCNLILHFDFETVPANETWFSGQRIWTIWDKPALMVKLIPVRA
ncbi:cytochrome P450 [Aspergillus brunneoviolaceus CBS 621.78]|uniref:Cytochrome P450 n=1 Tax=Aspergillus brunneoviolaceus CBS 621.78 TaxID=1450534 RepID=A0ACD1FUG6_9EURO|nr:cytochrome P450 [Aspergillus brunneoviolaceus CBS 621.78]RAH40560.1 cytochrome P450 [Aspergillus brunneoviolaceus CBS 621.78]